MASPTTTNDVSTEFEHAMIANSLGSPDPIIADGSLHRFDVGGDKAGSKNGWYVLYAHENPVGIFGSWKTGQKITWSFKDQHAFTSDERRQWQTKVDEAKKESERIRQELAQAAAVRAQSIREAAMPATEEHEYLARKRVKSFGVKVYKGMLLIPAYGPGGAIQTLQFIGPDGGKKFLKDGAKSGNYFTIGEPGEQNFLCEGFATGATIHEVTKQCVVVAFDCGNLKSEAERFQSEHPNSKIIFCADNDSATPGNPGLTKAREAAQAVNGLVVFPMFQSVNTNGTPPSDFNDLFLWEGADAVRAQLTLPQPSTQPTITADATPWPELEDGALYGLAGDVVKAILPYTEADQITLLVHLLAELSCMIGRGPHVKLDGGHSPLLFWPVVVGDTSKARKGSGSKRSKAVCRAVDPSWTRGRHSGTLSSGEGLIYAVRDKESIEKEDGEEIVKDPGISDKRLFLVQTEYGQMLKIMGREGSSLSGHLRDAWDGETLKPMTKANRIQATHPHIGVCGHVTQEELLRNLNDTETANGFGNRFCWFLVRRSKFLSRADNPPDHVFPPLIERLQAVLTHAEGVGEIGMTPGAWEFWDDDYKELSSGTPGLAGSLLDRAEAQVRRLAAIYALLDLQEAVDVPHLYAARCLWQFSVDSVKQIFGNRVGDHVAETILDALRSTPGGLTDTEISALFARHESGSRLSQAKNSLWERGLIVSETRKTSGRPAVMWLAKKEREQRQTP